LTKRCKPFIPNFTSRLAAGAVHHASKPMLSLIEPSPATSVRPRIVLLRCHRHCPALLTIPALITRTPAHRLVYTHLPQTSSGPHNRSA
jgi:hypothetical protein